MKSRIGLNLTNSSQTLTKTQSATVSTADSCSSHSQTTLEVTKPAGVSESVQSLSSLAKSLIDVRQVLVGVFSQILNVLLISGESVVTTFDGWFIFLNFNFWNYGGGVIEVGMAVRVVDEGGAGSDDFLLILNQTIEVLVVLGNSDGEVFLPFDDLVVLDGDVLASAASFTIVSILVVLNEFLVDNFFLGSKLAVDFGDHLVPNNFEVGNELGRFLLSARNTFFANVGQVRKTINPAGNEFGGEVGDEGGSSLIRNQVGIVESVPFNTTVVFGNPVLDFVVGPHGICVGGPSFVAGISFIKFLEFGNLFGGEG
jgi:hypothetical protein